MNRGQHKVKEEEDEEEEEAEEEEVEVEVEVYFCDTGSTQPRVSKKKRECCV